MEKVPEPKYSREKFDLLKSKYNESPLFFSEEVVAFVNHLRERYPDYEKYAFYHILSGSSIKEEFKPIEYEDFPENDSVETFIDNPEKYKLG